jgi:hypothetical protein
LLQETRKPTTVARKIQQPQFVDDHFARLALDFDPLPRQLVERLPVSLERRVHRRNLSNRATETWQSGL